jgi:hypothetical protein
MNITVTISDDGYAVLESWLGKGKVQVWLQNAINNKLRQRLDASVLEKTDKNPSKLSVEQKYTELSKIAQVTK